MPTKQNKALDDVSIISDMLTTQKSLLSRYTVALSEGSNDAIRKMLSNHLAEIAADQFDAFRYMNDRNLYPVEEAPKDKLTEAKNKFRKKKQEHTRS